MTLTNQTVTDRIADKLKSSEFGAWFGEDDLLALTREAIQRAFFIGKDPDYNGRGGIKPAVVTFAEQHIGAKIDKLVKEQVAAFVAENPDVVTNAINKAMSIGIDQMILRVVVNLMTSGMADFGYRMQQEITRNIANGLRT